MIARRRCHVGVVGLVSSDGGPDRELQNLLASRTAWKGRPQKVRVLYAKAADLPMSIPSSTEHVKFGVNLGGPPPKAKHYLATDSELVP